MSDILTKFKEWSPVIAMDGFFLLLVALFVFDPGDFINSSGFTFYELIIGALALICGILLLYAGKWALKGKRIMLPTDWGLADWKGLDVYGGSLWCFWAGGTLICITILVAVMETLGPNGPFPVSGFEAGGPYPFVGMIFMFLVPGIVSWLIVKPRMDADKRYQEYRQKKPKQKDVPILLVVIIVFFVLFISSVLLTNIWLLGAAFISIPLIPTLLYFYRKRK